MINQPVENAYIDWEEVLVCLQAYTRFLVKGKGWFRGYATQSFLKGKEIDDYVFTAIEKYLRNPEKYDSEKGSLLNYLKYNLIRTLVSNDLASQENRTSKDVYVYEDDDDDDSVSSYLDSILPHAEIFFDQEIDYKEVMSYLEEEVKSDPIVENIFLGLTGFGLKRGDIIKEFSISEKEFDNGMRRLNTLRKNAAAKYDIKLKSL